jgi:HAD superfamily hydrolase (TIGR01509 family)
VAVASNSPRSHLLAGLSRVGLLGRFEVVLGVEQVAEPKPAPDLYLRSCELLGVSPMRSIALEDSPPGVAAARAAGLYVVGVPSVAGVVLDADVVFDSLANPRVHATITAHLGRP